MILLCQDVTCRMNKQEKGELNTQKGLGCLPRGANRALSHTNSLLVIPILVVGA